MLQETTRKPYACTEHVEQTGRKSCAVSSRIVPAKLLCEWFVYVYPDFDFDFFVSFLGTQASCRNARRHAGLL